MSIEMGDGRSEPLFGGSVCDGADVSLPDLAGLSDDEKIIKALEAENEFDLLERCNHCRVEYVLDQDTGVPGGSDKYYQVWADDKDAFVAELRQLLLGLVSSRKAR